MRVERTLVSARRFILQHVAYCSHCDLDGVYGPGFTRMDTTWAFREAYEKARLIKHSQDEFCSKAVHGEWAGLGEFPEDLQWEALVDVLRGRVKVRP